jgi:hypothetical protein
MASRGPIFENIAIANPIRVFGNTLMFARNEFQLKSMLDVALTEDLLSGAISASIAKYPGAAQSLYPVRAPFDLPSAK